MASGVADLYVVVYRDRPQMLALSASAPTPSVLVRGGRERQDSVRQALAALPSDIAHVFIHDCARPLVRAEQLVALHKLVQRHRRRRSRPSPDRYHQGEQRESARDPFPGLTLRTLDRSRLWAMETPQVFARDLLCRAYARVAARGLRITDDAAAVEKLGQPIALLENPHPNPKLTHPGDLAYLEFLVGGRGDQAQPSLMLRIGHGYDIHRPQIRARSSEACPSRPNTGSTATATPTA